LTTPLFKGTNEEPQYTSDNNDKMTSVYVGDGGELNLLHAFTMLMMPLSLGLLLAVVDAVPFSNTYYENGILAQQMNANFTHMKPSDPCQGALASFSAAWIGRSNDL
jgi:hypothetical protein